MSKMTRKGQVTVPAAARKAMGVQPGDKIEFTALTDSTARLEVMRHMLHPISHERAQELMEERTRSAPETQPDTDGKRHRPDND
jgi:AbrB family looped-hinge helix DNA binding protein